MNISEKIKEWQLSHIDRACSAEEIEESNRELEMVLFAIDTLTDKALNQKSEAAKPLDEEKIKRKYINKIWQLMDMKKVSPSSRDYDLWVTSQQMLKSAIVAHLPVTS